MLLQMSMYLNKGEFADAVNVAGVSDRDLAVMFDPSPPAQNVVDARRHLVPLIVITITADKCKKYDTESQADEKTDARWINGAEKQTRLYLGSMTCTVPMGRISIDFPQNLFFHLTSVTQTHTHTWVW